MRRTGAVATFVLITALAGCASDRPGPAAAGDDGSGAAAAEAEAILHRLVNTDNGLEVRRWVVGDDPEVIAAAFARYRVGEPLDADRVAALRRDGLRFVRVRAPQLNDLLDELGPAPVEVVAWHGQVLTWRELQVRNIGPEGVTLAAGGRAHRLDAGRLRLMARSWTVPMEQGPYLNLELLPEYAPPPGPSLRRLLGAQDLHGRLFPTARVETLLEPGYAYILLGEAPQRRWPSADAGAAPAPAAPGPQTTVGPGAASPSSLGELLLIGDEPPTRALLVFVPRIPDRLWQPYDTAPAGASAGEGVVDAGAG
jgi:hypothetical protein